MAVFPIELFEAFTNTMKDGMLILDADFQIVYINMTGKDLLGIGDKDPSVSDGLSHFFKSKPTKIINKAKVLKLNWQKQIHQQKEFYTVHLVNITENIDLATKQYILESILENISDGVLVSDKEGRIIIYNKALQEIEGLSSCDVMGKTIAEVYQPQYKNTHHFKVQRTKKPVLDLNATIITSEGKRISLVDNIFPVIYEGDAIGAYSICRNETQIRHLLERTIKLQHELNLISPKQREKIGRYDFSDIVGNSSSLRRAISSAQKACQSDSPILIVGETGTGKELFVQSIHNSSSRCLEPFVPINCAAIPEGLMESILFGTIKGTFTGSVNNTGLFQQAGKGILFLDELNSMSLNLQSKLLRVLQEKTVRRVGGNEEIPVNCRVISTTNKDPLRCIEEGSLRSDLFYRLAVITIHIPPLRERKDDIELLTKYFIDHFAKKYSSNVSSVAPKIMDYFIKYHWPGNVRELQNLLESAVNMAGNEKIIKAEHLPYYSGYHLIDSQKAIHSTNDDYMTSLPQTLYEIEKKLIFKALEEHHGNITRAADALGIPRQNLHFKIGKLAINVNHFRT